MDMSEIYQPELDSDQEYEPQSKGLDRFTNRAEDIPSVKRRIVSLLASGLFISEISQQLGVPMSVIRRWRSEDHFFNVYYSDAETAYVDTIEKEAIRRAKYGILEPVVANGRVVMDPTTNDTQPLMSRKYSDPMLMFILKGKRREVYGDRQQIEQNTTLNVAGIKDALIERMMSRVKTISSDDTST